MEAFKKFLCLPSKMLISFIALETEESKPHEVTFFKREWNTAADPFS